MIKRECQEVGNVTQCQIPYMENGISGITDFIALVAMVWFVVHMVIRLLGRLVK